MYFGNRSCAHLLQAVMQNHIIFQMKFSTLIALTFITTCSFGQLKLIKLDSSSLPQQTNYVGHIIDSVKWKDSIGLRYVITTETGKIESKTKDEEGLFDAFLYGYHYLAKNGNKKLIWKIKKTSQILLEALGFLQEAYFSKNYYNGKFLDSAIFGLLAPDR